MVSTKSVRVVFFGTPELAVPTFEVLCSQYSVIGCVTPPDKPQGRKGEITPSPIKEAALKNGIPVFQPKSLKQTSESGQEFSRIFQQLQPDVAVLFAYGKIIPPSILSIPRHGFVNVHPSLLPLLRGASPIQYAILQGLPKTAVTIMLMDEGMDTGPILSQEEILLQGRETAGELHDIVKDLSAIAVQKTLPQYINGTIHPKPQDDTKATYCKILKKEDGEIDWKKSPKEIDQQVRAFSPWPGTFTICQGKRIKILETHIQEDGALSIDIVQPEGKKPMSYTDFVRGYPECIFGNSID